MEKPSPAKLYDRLKRFESLPQQALLQAYAKLLAAHIEALQRLSEVDTSFEDEYDDEFDADSYCHALNDYLSN